jgi:CO/xanthine dehydrogenase Mo-binding subunit
MDGSVLIRTGAPDVGAGQASSLCQIAAEVLGVPVERVSIHISDSALTPLAGTTTATRQLLMSGNAVLQAATQLRDQILRVAAELLEAPAPDLWIEDEAVRAPGGQSIPLVRVLKECARVGVPRSAFATYHAPAGDPIDLERGGGRVFPDFTYGAHAAEVEVDTETGAVRVRRYVACHDVGQAINPQSVEGQIQGGAAMGIGYALMEQVVLEQGHNLTTSFATYLIPSAQEVPDITPILVESGEGMGPFGARGIGEPPIGPPAAAIANAIFDAVGVRVSELPIRPEVVARALHRLE